MIENGCETSCAYRPHNFSFGSENVAKLKITESDRRIIEVLVRVIYEDGSEEKARLDGPPYSLEIAGEPERIAVLGDVYGEVESHADLECNDIQGNVGVGGDLTCGGLNGNVTAGGDINCDSVHGDINSGGDVNCTEIRGSVVAGGEVNADEFDDDDDEDDYDDDYEDYDE